MGGRKIGLTYVLESVTANVSDPLYRLCCICLPSDLPICCGQFRFVPSVSVFLRSIRLRS